MTGKRRGSKAPRVVGCPPADAGAGLIRADEREIRHYALEGVLRVGGLNRTGYTRSLDNGWTWTEEFHPAAPELCGEWDDEAAGRPGGRAAVWALVRNSATGEYFATDHGLHWLARAPHLDGPWQRHDTGLDPEQRRSVRHLCCVRAGRRLLAPASDHRACFALYSDDAGATWRKSNGVTSPDHQAGGRDLAPRWNHGPVEPRVVELQDDRLWMLIRTSQDNHYESFSGDGGTTWSPAVPSRFFGTCTMSTMGRLDDGRLLMSWNNTLPMPELPGPRREGWEDVFTNRDATHVAISDDDGRTWRGFRELYLDVRRNAGYYADTGGTDRGTHQSEFGDLGDGWVLVALGQHPHHRRLTIFHTDWLYETARRDDFSDGLEDWSTHVYVAGIRGHCAFNRREGARLVPHPEEPGRQVLHLGRPHDPSLVSESQGAVWNFPAGHRGRFTARVRLQPGGQGGRVSLLDRWVNPSDVTAPEFAMFTAELGDAGLHLTPGQWHDLTFSWRELKQPGRDRCEVRVDGVRRLHLPLQRASENGICYVQFLSTASGEDVAGFLVDRVVARVYG